MPGAMVAMTMRQHRINPVVIMLLKQSQVLPTSRFLTWRKGATTLAHLHLPHCFIQFSLSVMSYSFRPHGMQHTRPSCLSPAPGVYSNTCSLCQRCHPTISSSVVPFSSRRRSFPASGSFQMSQFFASGGQSIYQSFSFNISPSNEYSQLISFRMDWLDLLAAQGTLKSLLQHHNSKAIILQPLTFFIVQLSHPYMTTGKTIALTRWTFVCKVMSLLFNTLSRLVITFLPRSKRLLISWLQSPSAVILESPKIKSATVSTSICREVMGLDTMIFVFWMLSFKPTFSLSSFSFIKRLFSSSSLSTIRVVSSAYLRLLIFLLAILILACASSNPAFLMMYSANKLNKQGANIQPWCTCFPIWNQSVVPCPVLTVASWNLHTDFSRSRRGGVVFPSIRIFHSLLWSTQSKALA